MNLLSTSFIAWSISFLILFQNIFPFDEHEKDIFQLNLGKDNQIGAKQHSYILPLMYM